MVSFIRVPKDGTTTRSCSSMSHRLTLPKVLEGSTEYRKTVWIRCVCVCGVCVCVSVCVGVGVGVGGWV